MSEKPYMYESEVAYLRDPRLAGNPQREREDAILTGTAAATDLANTWARELGVQEAWDERGLHKLIGRLWDKIASVRYERDECAEALRRLAREAKGFLSMADPARHGVTNIRVLERKIEEALALVSDEIATDSTEEARKG